jgi:hypothetical protein
MMDFTFPFDHSAVEHLACNPPTDGQFSSPGTRQFYSNDFPYTHQNVVDAFSHEYTRLLCQQYRHYQRFDCVWIVTSEPNRF